MWFDKWEMKFWVLFCENLLYIKVYTLILLYDIYIMWSKLKILKLVTIVTANISAMLRKKVLPLSKVAAVHSVAHTYEDG